MEKNLYRCFGLFDEPEENRVAYAFLCHGNNSQSLILDYFATHPFQIGPHKALQIVKITKDKKVILKSEINKDIPKYLLDTTNDIQQLINKTLPTTGIMPRIALLPSATHVIPYDS